jgi:hypothetical protein
MIPTAKVQDSEEITKGQAQDFSNYHQRSENLRRWKLTFNIALPSKK